MIACSQCGQENPDGFRFCGSCGAELAAETPAVREMRKTVTVLFCDLAGYTSKGESLDPEALRRVQSEYFEGARVALERHGGSVEKFIGDAVMAVFGIPQVHEDDALRAVRAAHDLQEAVGRLGLQARVGVNTGEVVAGSGDALVTGDAVNVAARLEQAAPPGQILIGEETHQLCRDAVRAELIEPLAAKGKTEPVAAYRLLEVLEVLAGAPSVARRLDSPMVGRGDELAQLQQAYARAVRERRCHLFTVLGSAGVGKSRLAQELVGGMGTEARVLSGRCLSYGEGITYWPLVEVFRGAGAGAEQRLTAALDASTAEETFLAVRRFLEEVAREQPLVLVLDDLHWAEPTFLDLVEHVADWSRDAPILLLCLARPELLEARAAWGGGKVNASAILLEPLAESECDALIDALLIARLPEDVRRRIVQTADGNPLYVEQILAMIVEGNGELNVPPTIQALIAARLDGLPHEERQIIERAAMVGREFERPAVAKLAPEGAALDASLLGLVRKELIVPLPDSDGFRFANQLVRDAAYEAMPKELRAELHERFAEHLESREDVPEADEIIGYHLERAQGYRLELGPLDESGLELGRRAGERLAAAGRRAYARSDIPAAVNLLGRAAAILPERDSTRLSLLPDLGNALLESGAFDRARDVLDAAVNEARSTGDRSTEARARVEQFFLRGYTSPDGATGDASAAVGEIIATLEELGDERGLARAWRLVGQIHLMGCRFAEMSAAMERCLEHALRARDERQEADALFWLPTADAFGPVAATDGIRRVEALRSLADGRPFAEAGLILSLGILYAIAGRSAEARAAMRQGRDGYRDLGLEVQHAGAAMGEAWVELYSGDLVAAEAVLRDGVEVLERLGERSYLSTTAVVLAQVLVEQGRSDEAERWTQLAREAGAVDDIATQAGWRSQLARVLARRGELVEAERLANEGIELVEPTDGFDWRGEAYFALAEVHRAAERLPEAARAAARALDEWERKGAVRSVERARALLAELRGDQPPAMA